MRPVKGSAVLVGVVIATCLSAAPSARASETIASSEFASRCNGTQKMIISTDTRVQGGSGLFTKDCEATVATGITLVLQGASLSTPLGTEFGLIVDGGEASTIEVRDSSILLGGGMNLCPGYSYTTGEHFDRGQVVISGSTIQGSTFGLIIGASFGAHAGSVEITRSTLRGASGTVVLVQASCGGGSGYLCGEGPAIGGRVDIRRSTIDAGPQGRIDVTTEAAGRTTVSRNVLTAPAGTIAIRSGPGGRCDADDNVPPTTCR